MRRKWFQWHRLQQRQSQCYRWSVFWLCLAYAGPHTIVEPGSIPNNWADVCGFLTPPGSQRFWKVNEHGLRRSDQNCHHETWLHLHFVDMNSYWSKIGIFVKLMRKALMNWKNWSDFKVQHSTQLQEEDWSKIKILSFNFAGKIQELQNEINCMNDSRDFQDAESVRSDIPTLPVNLSFPPHPIPEVMLRPSFVSPRRREGPPCICDTHGLSETFLQIQMCLLQHLIRRNWIHGVLIYQNQFTHHKRWRMRIEDQFSIGDASPDRQPEIH